MPNQIVPKGFSFPLRFGPLGHFVRAEGNQKLKENLHHIALTAMEDRPLNPSFGNLSYRQLFRNVDETTCLLVSDTITRAITKYEDRVTLRRVSCVEIVDDPRIDGTGIEVTIDFRVKASGNFDSLTFVLGDNR